MVGCAWRGRWLGLGGVEWRPQLLTEAALNHQTDQPSQPGLENAADWDHIAQEKYRRAGRDSTIQWEWVVVREASCWRFSAQAAAGAAAGTAAL